MGANRHSLIRVKNCADLGMAGITIATTQTSNAWDATGFRQLMLNLNLTYAACTNLLFYLEGSEDNSVWNKIAVIDSVASGVITIFGGSYAIAPGAANVAVEIPIPICNKLMRLKVIGTGATTDAFTAFVRMGT